ncbi:MAG TPA: TolC family protein [Verrucomicrobiae bacterium]|nr:TolC family protein [Verrucomicrobiae bacterium]
MWAAHAETQVSHPQEAVSTPPRLSLAEAQQIAFERNWDLLAAKSGINSAEAQLIVVKEFPNPTFSWTTAKIGTHESATILGNSIWNRSYDTIAAVSQLVEIAGKRGDRQRAARAGVMGARARFFDAKRTLDQGVTKAYVAALLANENVRVLNESANYLKHEADIANARYKAGDISDSDRKQIEINAEQFQLQARAAEATAAQARVAVEILMGVPQPKGNWEPVDTLPLLVTASTPKDLDEMPQGSRSDVLAAEQDLRSARENLKLQKAIRIPDPTFSIQYEHEPPGGGPPIDTFGVGVSFPLPLWNRNGGNIKAAQAQQEQSAIALGKVKLQVMSDIANAAVAYKEASGRLHRYVDQIRPKAGSVRESVAFAYEKGGASLVDLLDAERTDNDVRLATAQAMSDTVSAAADLKAARAVLPETELTSSKP